MAGAELMLVEHRVKKGQASFAEHHENEQLTLVLSGKLKCTVGEAIHILEKGGAVLIPSRVVHSVEVLEDSTVIEVFSPPRKEWLSSLGELP